MTEYIFYNLLADFYRYISHINITTSGAVTQAPPVLPDDIREVEHPQNLHQSLVGGHVEAAAQPSPGACRDEGVVYLC